ncbi:MAG: DUF5131 family protein [Rhodospirillaceae bacterium]
MADQSKIEWTDSTWNPITGCSPVSDGCHNCYAARLAATRLKHHRSRAFLAKITESGRAVFTGEVCFNPGWLEQPLHWRKPRRIFVAAHSDLFHPAVTDDWRDQVFAIIALSPQYKFQVLTKRPERAVNYFGNSELLIRVATQATILGRHLRQGHPGSNPENWSHFEGRAMWKRRSANVTVGCSVESQQNADLRRQSMYLINLQGHRTWVSYEPALGPVNLSGWEFLKGIVAGGESGPLSRPAHPDWFRKTREWCAANKVGFHFKQWGAFHPSIGADSKVPLALNLDGVVVPCDSNPDAQRLYRVGKAIAGRELDGVTHDWVPE